MFFYTNVEPPIVGCEEGGREARGSGLAEILGKTNARCMGASCQLKAKLCKGCTFKRLKPNHFQHRVKLIAPTPQHEKLSHLRAAFTWR